MDQAVLRKLNVADLPLAYETGRVAVATAVINKGLTDRRCLVKAAVCLKSHLALATFI